MSAVTTITLADVSMSLDNVLAVAGVAKGSPLVLVFGLAIAIILMAVASRVIAELLVKFPWITWIGLLIIVWVALEMIYSGSHEVTCRMWNFGCSETLWEASSTGSGSSGVRVKSDPTGSQRRGDAHGPANRRGRRATARHLHRRRGRHDGPRDPPAARRRASLEIRSIDPERRKDRAARQALMREVDLLVLCLPDEAAREAVALAAELGAEAPRILDAPAPTA